MSQSIYDVAVPTLLRVLGNLSVVLDKGRAHAEAEKIEPSVLLNMRLYPDMFPLTRQVQIVSDGAKGCVARLAFVEPPKFEDTETSFAQLQARIEKTAAYLRGFEPRQLEGSESRTLEMTFRNGSMKFKNGWDFLLTIVFPNVYFHATTAYDILRHCGVKLAKADFLGSIGSR